MSGVPAKMSAKMLARKFMRPGGWRNAGATPGMQKNRRILYACASFVLYNRSLMDRNPKRGKTWRKRESAPRWTRTINPLIKSQNGRRKESQQPIRVASTPQL